MSKKQVEKIEENKEEPAESLEDKNLLKDEESLENGEDKEESAESEEAGEGKEKKIKEKKKAEAVVNIYTSFNNTIVHATDMAGRTLSKVTGGMVTKHGRLKANPTIAMFIAKRVGEQLKEIGVGNLYFRIRAKTGNPAPGPGANAIIKSLSREGFKILNILDTTRFPRGGPKKKGGRRGRRP
ncbi:MAG: 30S ribosomal protein S11 [Nanoarchaeota archaeon]|mgnify:CR=1 FL=1